MVPPKVGANPSAPFSNGVMVGETFYVAGSNEQYPARAFIGINKLVRGARFEVAGVTVTPRGPASCNLRTLLPAVRG